MFRSLSSLRCSLLIPALLLAGLTARAQKAPYSRSSEPLILDQKTVIPSKTLDPGTYSIRIVDQFSDRFILQVEDEKGTAISTFIGLYNPDFNASIASSQHGPVFWPAAPKGSKAIRAFGFHNGNTLEFAYPKEQAVTLAKLNTNSVPAIDPESEGRKPDPKLSPEDRQVVTLWLLKATRVGAKQETPAIEAKRYAAPVQPAPAQVQVATAPTPIPLPAKQVHPVPVKQVQPAPAKQARQSPVKQAKTVPVQQTKSAPVQVAKLEPDDAPRIRSSVKRLPQTASELPLILLFSLLSLATAGGLRLARTNA